MRSPRRGAIADSDVAADLHSLRFWFREDVEDIAVQVERARRLRRVNALHLAGWHCGTHPVCQAPQARQTWIEATG